MPRLAIVCRIHAVGLVLLAMPGLALAQMAPPQPRPVATPVMLGSTVTGAIGQHTIDAIRQGTELAAASRETGAPRKTGAPILLPAGPADTIASR